MESDSDDSKGSENICPICWRSFDTLAGIRQHWTKGHTASEFEQAVNDNSQRSAATISASSPPAPSTSVSVPPATLSNIDPVITHPSSDLLRNRILCNVCGFLAKNERGLKRHASTHGRQPATTSASTPTLQFDFESLDDSSLIRKFGELLYKCKCSIPLVRIIQKSVRTVVCLELAKIVENVVAKNDVLSWFRLLSFPHIVLNTVSRNSFKSNHRPNIIRHNLSVFSKLNDIPSLFNELLNLLSIDLPKKKLSQSEKLIIKIAQRKIGEDDIGGAVRVLCSQEGMAKTHQRISKN